MWVRSPFFRCLHLKLLRQFRTVRSVRGQGRVLGGGCGYRGWMWDSLRPGLDYPANLFKLSLPSGPVSSHVVHVIITLGFRESILEPLLFRPRGLDMGSAELDSAEFGVCPVVIEVPRLQRLVRRPQQAYCSSTHHTEVGRDECLVNVDQRCRREARGIRLCSGGDHNGMSS